MFLVEQTSVPVLALPVAEFRDHLLLGSGFADDAAQDSMLEHYLRAAISAIEARTGKVLIEKQYSWTVTFWRDQARVALPLAPVSLVSDFRLIDRLGNTTQADPANYRLVPDAHRPVVAANTMALPTIPTAGTAEIDFTAGYGPAWTDLPDDLRQAVLLLAAYHYEYRNAAEGGADLPFSVACLIEPYRNIRLFGGPAR